MAINIENPPNRITKSYIEYPIESKKLRRFSKNQSPLINSKYIQLPEKDGGRIEMKDKNPYLNLIHKVESERISHDYLIHRLKVMKIVLEELMNSKGDSYSKNSLIKLDTTQFLIEYYEDGNINPENSLRNIDNKVFF